MYAKWVPKHGNLKEFDPTAMIHTRYKIQGPRCYCLVSRVRADTDTDMIVVMTDECLHLSIITQLSVCSDAGQNVKRHKIFSPFAQSVLYINK